jgi:hypothetical protein
MKALFRIALLLLFVFPSTLSAQQVTQHAALVVPDLTGLSVPRAAAELNRVGLRLGNQTDESWVAGQTLPEGGISTQSLAAGTSVEAGTTIDVTVLRSPNLELKYDDNDLTLINLTDKTVDIGDTIFAAIDGNQASFEASQLTNSLLATQCVQLWAVNRNGPKDMPECGFIPNWVSSTNAALHFWVTTNGATSFNVVQDGTVRATCSTAAVGTQDQPLTCDFYLPSGGQGGDAADYLYFTYTTERFLVVNTASDEWMRLNRAVIHHVNPNNPMLGPSFNLSDPALFGNPTTVADFKRLAPQQCLLFKRADVAGDPLPQPCDVIGQLDLPADQLFWTTPFELESRSGKRFTCPAAVEGKQTICAMPR